MNGKLKNIDYDDYDRLIQLCDCLAMPEGVVSLSGALGAVNSNAHRLDGQRICFRLEFVDSSSKTVEKYGKYLISDMRRFFVVRKKDRQGRSPAAELPGFFLACGDGYM